MDQGKGINGRIDENWRNKERNVRVNGNSEGEGSTGFQPDIWRAGFEMMN